MDILLENKKIIITFFVIFYLGSLLLTFFYLSSFEYNIETKVMYLGIVTLSFILVISLFIGIYFLSKLLAKTNKFDKFLYYITKNEIFKN